MSANFDQVISFIKKLSLNIQSGFLVLIDIRFPSHYLYVCKSLTFFFQNHIQTNIVP